MIKMPAIDPTVTPAILPGVHRADVVPDVFVGVATVVLEVLVITGEVIAEVDIAIAASISLVS
jgi:hypothetical protein